MSVLAERARGTNEKGNETVLRRDDSGCHCPVETTPALKGAKDCVIKRSRDGLPASKDHINPGHAVPITGG